MANVLAGGDGIMGQFPLEQWFYEMPVVTRWWMTAALSASVLVQCRMLNPYQLFYSWKTVFLKSQVCVSCCEPQVHADMRGSTGGSRPRSSTLALSASTFSITYFSFNDTPACSKSPRAVLPLTSHGSSPSRRQLYSAWRPCCPWPSWARRCRAH
jgi:hypothetical protein